MQQNQFTESDSLRIIQEMISAAKTDQADSGKSWIIWGWMLFIASLLSFLNTFYQWFGQFYFWNLFGLVTIILFSIEIIRNFYFKKTVRVQTYTADIFKRLNLGFFLTLVLIILSINIGVPPVKGFSLLMGLYAFWVLIYGTMLKFRPSIYAAYIMWAIAFAGLFLTEFRWVMLLHAAGVLIGYIIPGHIANNEFRKLKRGENS